MRFKLFCLLLLLLRTDIGTTLEIHINTPDEGELNAETTTRNILDYSIQLKNYRNNHVGDNRSVKLDVKACHDAVVFLSESDSMRSSQPFYEIVLGSYTNTKTYLLRRNDDSLGLSSFITINPDHPNIGTQNSLSRSDYKAFWISWMDGQIKIGSGSTLFDNVFADWRDPVPIEVKSIGLLTFWGATGEWRIHVEDLFTGLFSGCSEDNNKADMIVLQSMGASRFACGSICSFMDNCFGFNFKATNKRCELLSIYNLSNGIAKKKVEGWRFYSKCFKHDNQCLGCY